MKLYFVLFIFFVGCLEGCSSSSQIIDDDRGEFVQLYLEVEPVDSVVQIDSVYWGRVRDLVERGPLVLRNRSHRMKISREGYFPYYYEIPVYESGESFVLKVKLIRRVF